jgi:hypothetical protein
MQRDQDANYKGGGNETEADTEGPRRSRRKEDVWSLYLAQNRVCPSLGFPSRFAKRLCVK